MLEAALIAGLNHLLQGAGWARERLRPFAGRQASIEMPPFRLAFAVTPAGLLDTAAQDAQTDVTITLPATTPLRLFQGLDKLMAGARVAGDAEFATVLSFVFRHLHWDAEEDLSHWVGDIAAHRIIAGVRRTFAWQRQAAASLAGNFAEYLIHEKRLLVSRTEFVAFREALARFDAELNRFEDRCKTIV